MCRSFCVFSSFRKTSRSTVAGWDDKSFVRSVFRSACNILRSYQQRNGVSAAPRLSPRSLLSAFWILAVLLATSLSLLGPVWCCPESVCNWRGDCSYVTMDKSDLFFHDYSIAPLFVQENYIHVKPVAAGWVFRGGEEFGSAPYKGSSPTKARHPGREGCGVWTVV